MATSPFYNWGSNAAYNTAVKTTPTNQQPVNTNQPWVQAAMQASIAANPQSTFGPSPFVDYNSIGTSLSETPSFQNSPAGQGGQQPYDPSVDYLQGQISQQRQKLQGSTTEQIKRRLMAFGSRELAAKVLGENDPFVTQISDDPTQSTSWMAEANRRLRQLLSQTSENLGHNYGLWNSSGRTNALSDIGREHQVATAREAESVQDDLYGIQGQMNQAESEWMQRLWEAQMQAFRNNAASGGSGAPGGGKGGASTQNFAALNPAGQTAYQAALTGGQSPYVPEIVYQPPSQAKNVPVDGYQYPYYYGGQKGSVYAT